jgi:hypothetical protein
MTVNLTDLHPTIKMSKIVTFQQQMAEAKNAVTKARNVLNQANQRGLALPRAFPTLWVLHQLTKQHQDTDYAAHKVGGVWRGARVSRRNQARVRKVALLVGLDPVVDVGLPVKKGIVGFPWSKMEHRQIVAKAPTGKDLDKKYARYKKIQQEVTAVKLKDSKPGKDSKAGKTGKDSKPTKDSKGAKDTTFAK